jgi:hypothetical protein
LLETTFAATVQMEAGMPAEFEGVIVDTSTFMRSPYCGLRDRIPTERRPICVEYALKERKSGARDHLVVAR